MNFNALFNNQMGTSLNEMDQAALQRQNMMNLAAAFLQNSSKRQGTAQNLG